MLEIVAVNVFIILDKIVLNRGGQIDTNIDNIDTNVGIGIDRYQRENIDT